MADDEEKKQCVKVELHDAGFECKQSVLCRADGSASFKQGGTEVLSAVYGPAEVRMNKELIDKATIECNFKPKSGIPGCVEKVIERFIRNSCDSIILSSYHPRSAISIIVQVLNDTGYLLSTACNSAFMALLNAGIPLKCMAGAVSCFLMNDDGICFDASHQEPEMKVASLTFVFENQNEELITSYTQGKYSIEQYFKCLAASRKAVKSVFAFQRLSVERCLSVG